MVDSGVRILIHMSDTVDFYILAVFWQLAVRSMRTLWAGGGSVEELRAQGTSAVHQAVP